MILYLDTSAFLKLYLQEPDSRAIQDAVSRAQAVCTHLIAYAELRAALAQAVRMGRLCESSHAAQKARFAADWEATDVITVDEVLVQRAGHLAETCALRGYDSVHLAAAERIQIQVGDTFRMAVFDHALRAGAQSLGIQLLQQT